MDQHRGLQGFPPPEPAKSSSNRTFGLFFAIVFLAVALAPLLDGGGIRLWAAGTAAGFLAAGLFRPGLLAPLNRAWTRFGLFLHRLVSPVVLAAIYILAIVPTALVMRVFGYDSMRRRFDPDAESYWILCEPAESEISSMKRQF